VAAMSVSPLPVWSALSDRPNPSNPGYKTRASSRPGGQSPGGVGCDVKHGSYERYLNRIKGVRRNIKEDITGITTVVAGCKCDNTIVYKDPKTQNIDGIQYVFGEGDQVYAKESGKKYYSRAIIMTNDGNNVYTIKFDYDDTIETKYISELRIYTQHL
jgi:hypothetical protein